MVRKKIHPNPSAKAASHLAKLIQHGGMRANMHLSPDAVAALEFIKSVTGEGATTRVICRLLVEEADRLAKRSAKR